VRDEAWFKNAKEGKWEWTPPSYSAPKPRVTVSAPIFAPSGDKLGVLAVSISIDNLSDNLNRNDLSPNSSALVANDENHLISHSDREVGQADENDMSRFEIAGFGDDGIVDALKALYANGDKFVSKAIRRVTYDYHGETYHAVFHSYSKSGLDWTVVIMAPESDFIHGIRSAQNRQILIVVSLSFLITLIAFMVVLRFLKPVDELQESILRNQLTGLYNRRALDTLGNGMILEARRKELSVSVAMIDIDRFKRINDTYGHPVGDEVLVTISQRMQNVLKKTDILVRYGGEEFALMMVGANLSEARQICERIRVAVATDPVLTEAGAIQVTVSIGVQEIPEFEEEFAPSLSLADQALFVAKRSGRNQVCDPSDLDRPEPTNASASKPVSA
jgi:diguanylate cyclase (GGDEF)-like protein